MFDISYKLSIEEMEGFCFLRKARKCFRKMSAEILYSACFLYPPPPPPPPHTHTHTHTHDSVGVLCPPPTECTSVRQRLVSASNVNISSFFLFLILSQVCIHIYIGNMCFGIVDDQISVNF